LQIYAVQYHANVDWFKGPRSESHVTQYVLALIQRAIAETAVKGAVGVTPDTQFTLKELLERKKCVPGCMEPCKCSNLQRLDIGLAIEKRLDKYDRDRK